MKTITIEKINVINFVVLMLEIFREALQNIFYKTYPVPIEKESILSFAKSIILYKFIVQKI